jgi:hypothetical protein
MTQTIGILMSELYQKQAVAIAMRVAGKPRSTPPRLRSGSGQAAPPKR